MLSKLFEYSQPLARVSKIFLTRPKHRNFLGDAGFCPHSHFVAITSNNVVYPFTSNAVVYGNVKTHFVTSRNIMGKDKKQKYSWDGSYLE